MKTTSNPRAQDGALVSSGDRLAPTEPVGETSNPSEHGCAPKKRKNRIIDTILSFSESARRDSNPSLSLNWKLSKYSVTCCFISKEQRSSILRERLLKRPISVPLGRVLLEKMVTERVSNYVSERCADSEKMWHNFCRCLIGQKLMQICIIGGMICDTMKKS